MANYVRITAWIAHPVRKITTKWVCRKATDFFPVCVNRFGLNAEAGIKMDVYAETSTSEKHPNLNETHIIMLHFKKGLHGKNTFSVTALETKTQHKRSLRMYCTHPLMRFYWMCIPSLNQIWKGGFQSTDSGSLLLWIAIHVTFCIRKIFFPTFYHWLYHLCFAGWNTCLCDTNTILL